MRLVLYAVSSPYAAEALETAARLGWEVAACVRNMPGLSAPDEVSELVEADELSPELVALPFTVAVITPAHRRSAIADARSRGFRELISLVDPTAIVAGSSKLSEGAFINAGAIIAAGTRAGTSCLVNRGASIGHHCEIGDYVTVGPGVVTGGGCSFDSGAFLGIGSVIHPGIEVGANAVVGAGSVVTRNVAEGAVVVGNPAAVLRYGEGYGGVGVPVAHPRIGEQRA